MDVRCDKCATTYELDIARVTDSGVNVRCSRCGNLFRVRRRSSVTQEMPGLRVTTPRSGAAAVAPEAPASASSANLPSRLWFLRLRHNQEVLRFRDLTTLRRWILDKRVARDDDVSRSGARWRRLGTIVELESFFHEADQVERSLLRERRGRITSPTNTGRHPLVPVSTISAVPAPMANLGSRGHRTAPLRLAEDGAPSGAMRISSTGRTMRPRLPDLPVEALSASPEPASPLAQAIDAARLSARRDSAAHPIVAPAHPPSPSGAIPQVVLAQGPDRMHHHVLGQSGPGLTPRHPHGTAASPLPLAPVPSATSAPAPVTDEAALPTARVRSFPVVVAASGRARAARSSESGAIRRSGVNAAPMAPPPSPARRLALIIAVVGCSAAALLSYTVGVRSRALAPSNAPGPGSSLSRMGAQGLREGRRILDSDVEEDFPQAEDQLLRAAGANDRDALPQAALAELHATWSRALSSDAQGAEPDLQSYLASEARRHLLSSRRHADEALSRAPNSPEAHRALALVLVVSDAPAAEVEAQLQRAEPGGDRTAQRETQWVRALLLLRQQRSAEARALLITLLSRSTADDLAPASGEEALWRVRPALTLGRIFQEAGDVDAARQQFSEVLGLSPSHRRARAALAALASPGLKG